MNGSTDVGIDPFSRDGYNPETISMIILGVCGGIVSIIYSLKRLTECKSKCDKICCIESDCKQQPEEQN